MIMIPALILIAMFLSIYGGIKAGEWSGILTPNEFITGARSSFKLFTLVFSLIKTVTFAFIICTTSAYYGFYTRGGALEVGKASTKAVVYSSVMILFGDYILAQLMLP